MQIFKWRFRGPKPPHPPLFHLKAFWVMVLFPLFVAGIVWFLIFKSLGYPDWMPTKEGFDNAYEYFKIPLWVAALSLPFAGFYASHHRSVQTVAQISATESKNNFENSIKHREYIIGQLQLIEERNHIEFEDYHRLYEEIFVDNNLENFFPWADHSFEDGSYILKRTQVLICSTSEVSSSSIYNPFRCLSIRKYYGIDIGALDDLVLVVDEPRYDGISIKGVDGVDADVAILCTLGSLSKIWGEIASIALSPRLGEEVEKCESLMKNQVRSLYDSISESFEGNAEYRRKELVKQTTLWFDYLKSHHNPARP
ncbi:hypothetical protein FJM67_12640 [Maribrevibacterium harenarium]|uniref:Uncharacterized protein n=1 Tax=Maribrevibacterium harenarium TaxID=2589817 RepID=A0A501WLL9_9GAMM|nr:hypothetical protein [Maribrevibacterium harenarium]TPE49034.1 hypothetical protein FJM67_12640 [Maribrevibacterium harenarium]